MTLETIDGYGRVVMAGTAKMLRAADRNWYQIRTGNGMATYAFLEAVSLAANAFEHRIITLVHEQVHMVSPHELGIFDTTLALAPGDNREGHTT